ncbi:MAG: hypothetical protein BGO98_40240 [Myxococcales bacterium 68-20]|nr:MAG: hypothetical protein BGO98_40240 [Myxococcales bacterium 68-20]
MIAAPLSQTPVRDEKNLLCLIVEVNLCHTEVSEAPPDEIDVRGEELLDRHPCGHLVVRSLASGFG